MATADGPGPDHLTHFDRFCQTPQAYHIFQALRVIEARFADAPPMGTAKRPREDRVRLAQEAELAFPPSTIRAFTPPAGDAPGELINRFFGLFGPHGPLPLHLTEYARERQINARDPTFVAFANMLTHRMMGLLYRAWATGNPATSFDRGEDGLMERKVAALTGLHGARMRNRDAMPDLAKRYFAGHLSAGPRNAESLESMLESFFRTPVRVQQFVGSWLDLEPSDRWQIGARAGLGQATSIGARVWSRTAKFRLRVGPLSLPDYQRMLPGTPSMARLTSIVRTHVGDSLDWDVNLVLKGDQVPVAILGQSARLGHTSWLGRRQTQKDADELMLSPQTNTGMAA